MSAQGDAYRTAATTLRAAKPAIQGTHDWYVYFKKTSLANAYKLVLADLDAAADRYDALGAAADASDPIPPAGEHVPGGYAGGYSGGYGGRDVTE